MPVSRQIVYYSGHVQGVGFRYQTMQVARGFEVTGYVRNLADGRVQLEVEGRQKEVEDFLATLQSTLDGYIRKVEQTVDLPPAGFSGFTIQ